MLIKNKKLDNSFIHKSVAKGLKIFFNKPKPPLEGSCRRSSFPWAAEEYGPLRKGGVPKSRLFRTIISNLEKLKFITTQI